jgi:DNA-binding CsgD family transcriptional regulator
VSALVDPIDGERWRHATSEASTGAHPVTVVVRTLGERGAPTEHAGPVLCDVLLLPLQPGFTFIFLPVSDSAMRPLDAGGVRSMLADLSRIAAMAEVERQRISGLTETDLPGLAQLTARERDMLTRLIAGYRVTGIAEDLVLSPSTVRTHLASIFAKLGVSNQSDLLTAVRSSRRADSAPSPAWS